MWKSLLILANLANLIIFVSSTFGKKEIEDSHTIVTIITSGNSLSDVSFNAASCGGDNNAMFGCGNHCGKRCSTYIKRNISCSDTCYADSCDCKQGYLFDDYTGKCVLPRDCSNKDAPDPEAGVGTHGNGGLEEDDTSSCDNCYGDCDQPDGESDKNSKQDQCSSNDVKGQVTEESPDEGNEGENESESSSGKKNEMCSGEPNAIPGCDKECKNRCHVDKPSNCKCPEKSCMCIKGYVYSPARNKCVKPEECESGITATNKCYIRDERYYECASACPDNYCSDYLNHNITRCNIRRGSSDCKPGCRCRNGRYRNAEGECLSGGQCRRYARTTTPASTTWKGVSSAFTSSSEMMSTLHDPEICDGDALQLYVEANLGFTAKMLSELTLQNVGKNILFGGSSILFLMSQLELFTSGDSFNQLSDVVGLNIEQIKCVMPKIYEDLSVENPYTEFDVIYNIIADNSCVLTDGFKDVMQDVFQISPINMNFSDELSAKSLSDTIASLTNNGIMNFLTSDDLSTLSSLVLVDAQIFSGEWEENFDPRKTTELDFYRSDGKVVKKPTMYQSGRFLYAESESLECKVMTMNYKGGEDTLVIFLPNTVDGLDKLVTKLTNVYEVTSTLNSLTLMDLEVYLPKFNLSTSSRLKIPITKINVDTIFSADTAELSGVASCEKPYVSDILQTITLILDEGNENAVISDLNKFDDGPSNPAPPHQAQTFKADHPFVYNLFRGQVLMMSGIYLY